MIGHHHYRYLCGALFVAALLVCPQLSRAGIGSAKGTVFNDVNGNGVLDGGDVGLLGNEVDLYDGKATLRASTNSAANGSYSPPLSGIAALARCAH